MRSSSQTRGSVNSCVLDHRRVKGSLKHAIYPSYEFPGTTLILLLEGSNLTVFISRCSAAATAYCFSTLGDIFPKDLNPYDVRGSCDVPDDASGTMCYKETGWINTWLDKPEIKTALGVDPNRHFESKSSSVHGFL